MGPEDAETLYGEDYFKDTSPKIKVFILPSFLFLSRDRRSFVPPFLARNTTNSSYWTPELWTDLWRYSLKTSRLLSHTGWMAL